jgi:uncharacterized protein (TIGR02246 family)
MTMKTRVMLIVASLTLLCTACAQAPAASTDKTAADSKAADMKAANLAAIKALEDRFMAAWKAKDVKAIMACYVPDDTLLVFDITPPRQYVGAQAYTKDWEDIMGLLPGPLEADLTDLDVTAGDGDVAYGHSIQHFAGSMKDGKKLEATVRVTDGYRKVNGQWLIAHEHVSVPVDLATAKADLTSKP